MSKKLFIKGALLLSAAGLLTRLIGFFYRIFLSHIIGAEGIGIYQLMLPLQTLILSVTTSGIHMAIARLCASRFALKKKQEAWDYFVLAASFSVLLTALLSLCLYRYADFFAIQILKETRTAPLLKIISFSLPLGALHSCISGFYFAKKDTRVPAFLLLIEQLIRTGSTYLFYQICLLEKREITASLAALGSLSGEAASALLGSLILSIYFYSCRFRLFHFSNTRTHAKDLFSMSIPLSLNRILLTLLSSIEAVLIPQQLHKFGLSSPETLRVYGIFTGMALPLILFPCTITNSVSAMLLPSIAELQALGLQKRIYSVSKTICRFTLLLGASCCLLFYLFGNFLGNYMFHNASAGDYIRSMAFLCPFLYLHTTLSGILHGLGRSKTCLLQNLLAAGVRLFFVIFSVPYLGIRGYLYGMLVCELLLSLLHYFSLSSAMNNASVASISSPVKEKSLSTF